LPYAVKFSAYIFVANVLAFVIVARWLHPFGFMASMAFGLVFAYLTIVTGRWLFWAKGTVIGESRLQLINFVVGVLDC
jgi:hypothetical protein